MADPAEFQVHQVRVTQQAVLSPRNNTIQNVHHVSYMVGDHGPFTDTYPPGAYNSASVVANMQKQVSELREISVFSARSGANG